MPSYNTFLRSGKSGNARRPEDGRRVAALGGGDAARAWARIPGAPSHPGRRGPGARPASRGSPRRYSLGLSAARQNARPASVSVSDISQSTRAMAAFEIRSSGGFFFHFSYQASTFLLARSSR